jgi:hypothetical protein
MANDFQFGNAFKAEKNTMAEHTMVKETIV